MGESCQDSCWALVESVPNVPPTLSMFVSDGAGSALRGGEGADHAIEAAADFVTKKLSSNEFGISDDLAVGCVMAVRERIYAIAEREGLKARDYACTFLGVLSSSLGTLVMQIGDGGVVLDVGNGLEVPVVPMSGEYANMTHFVTDEDAIDVLVAKGFSSKASRVAVFTDGLQRLALNMATNTAHEPFFAPLFNVLANAPAEQADQLEGALFNFLNSESVNERTDDDKTLALAVLME